TQLWIERADYDLDTAEAMLKSARYLYVAFACQQAVEKYLKAIIQKRSGKHPPYTHNLPSLLQLSGMSLSHEQQEFLMLLTQYYINSRYVDFKQKLFEGMSREKAKDCFNKTKDIILCLKKELKI
ncbi:MAG: HEPN domain-containing protein, partial [Pseudomonadota bacterium]